MRNAWISFHLLGGLGSIRLRRLIDRYQDPVTAWEIGPRDWADLPRFGSSFCERLLSEWRRINPLTATLRAKQQDVQLLTPADPDYPYLLRHIYDPPAAIYVRGELRAEDQATVAIVGTRRPTDYGIWAAQTLASDLAEAGLTIVSGLAVGIDGTAHEAALGSGGRTLAVLGSGVDRLYPREHRKLVQRICRSGAVLSEFALGTPPERGHFPARNRLISGLSLGVLVIEAGHKSGALITAGLAGEQGRDVMAVPGDIRRWASAGPNQLIQDGARPVMRAEDVLHELERHWIGWKPSSRNATGQQGLSVSDAAFSDATPTEQRLLLILHQGPLSSDDLARTAGLLAENVQAGLLRLELQGRIRRLPGGAFAAVEVYKA